MSAADATITVNGIAVDPAAAASPMLAALRELLRQRAVALGLLSPAADDPEIAAAIESLLDREVAVPSATEAECRRYYEAHRADFTSGDLVFVRHILFQIAPGSPVDLIREQAEETLAQLLAAPDEFEVCALTLSNCPSGRQGGNLGQLGRGDTVPEFEEALFADRSTGVLPRLVKTRHGFHIVAIDRRIAGRLVPFEAVQVQIAERLAQRTQEVALRQYVLVLAGQAELRGVALDAAPTPLVQ